jgi:23S rRNA (uracil1939-C5)-methyltransferase
MNVRIEKLIYGGEGLAHAEGTTIFVPFVLPEESVEIHPVERKKNLVRGRVEQILTPSSGRIAPRCRHFTVCGGCHYQHIPIEAQLGYKTEILRETLRRIGRMLWTGPIVPHASSPWAYRNRAQWKIRPVGAKAADAASRAAIGYFGASSSALCAAEECPILSPLLEKTLAALRGALAEGALPITLREIEAFANHDDTKLLLNASFAGMPRSPAPLAETFRSLLPSLESILMTDPGRDAMELFGPGFLTYQVAGRAYRVGHLSFFQVNRYLLEELSRTVAGSARGALALDLYAGVGLFSLPLAEAFDRVVAVEANPASARDLGVNIAARGSRIEIQNADVVAFLKKWREKPDFVVLDPPRAGVSPGVLARLKALAPPAISYLSCEPSTLARDLDVLIAAGYALEELHVFDLFPQTFHIESLVRLTRSQ